MAADTPGPVTPSDRPAPAFAQALVTGATGFIGSHLARRLVAAGVDTTVLARPTSDLGGLAEAASRVTVLRVEAGDGAIVRAVAKSGAPVVLHLAAQYVAEHRPEDVAPMVAANVGLTAEVCEGLQQAGGRALVAAGTAAQHAGTPAGDATPAPNTLYAATKQAAEDILGYYGRDGAFVSTVLKIYDTFGPDDPRGRFLDALAATSRDGRRLQVSPGEQRLHMLHVDDVVDGFVHAANLSVAEELSGHNGFALPSAKAVTLRALADAWSDAAGVPAPVDWGANPYRAGEIFSPWEGTPLPGWSARIPLEDGLRRVYG